MPNLAAKKESEKLITVSTVASAPPHQSSKPDRITQNDLLTESCHRPRLLRGGLVRDIPPEADRPHSRDVRFIPFSGRQPRIYASRPSEGRLRRRRVHCQRRDQCLRL